MTSVVPYSPASGPDEPERSPKVRQFLERQTLPSPARVKQSARWWATEGSKGVGALALKAPYLALAELRPIFRGLIRITGGWARWCGVAESAEAIRVAEGSDRGKLDDRYQTRKSGRRKLSLLVLLLLVGGGWWAYFAYPLYLLLAGIVFVVACDAVGRASGEKTTSLPPPMRTILKEGVPLSQISAAVVDTMLREGLEIGIARGLRFDAARHEYRMQISCLDELKPEHLRAIERSLGAADHSIRNLATDTATVRELVIRDGDPLAEVPLPDFIPTGSVSIADPLDLGASVTDTPFAVTFAGVHTAIIGRTGSGKTKGMLWAVIDRLVACHDVVLFGIDLAGGPALPMWRGCIQRTAYNPQAAAVVLAKACAEIDLRMNVLRELAENDNPDDDQDEWASNLGPALVVVVDEFALVAEQNGEKGKADLMNPVEKILRLGRKVWVTLIVATQKAGNSDLGSTVAAAQIGNKILMSCTERDTTLMLGTEMRDAGWAPHLLKPATEGAVRDAGKAYVSGPAHHTADIYRSYAPMAPGEVKRRARQRLADGLPYLDGRDDAVDVAEVPPILVAVEQAFADAGNPEWIATVDLLPAVQAQGFPELTENALSSGIPVDKNEPGSRKRRPGEKNVRQGYLLTSIRKAMDQL